MRWKSSLRQVQNETADLVFLGTQKDKRVAQLEADLLRMRQKLDKVQAKLYLPSQDAIIGGLNSHGQPHNVIRGAAQTFEMNHQVEHEQEYAGEGEDSPARFN